MGTIAFSYYEAIQKNGYGINRHSRYVVVRDRDTRSLCHSKLLASEMDLYYSKHLSYRKKFICFSFFEKPVDTVGSMKELSASKQV